MIRRVILPDFDNYEPLSLLDEGGISVRPLKIKEVDAGYKNNSGTRHILVVGSSPDDCDRYVKSIFPLRMIEEENFYYVWDFESFSMHDGLYCTSCFRTDSSRLDLYSLAIDRFVKKEKPKEESFEFTFNEPTYDESELVPNPGEEEPSRIKRLIYNWI